ncbi:MAG: Multi-domain regulatory protein [Frankiales bacterium]|nr:Multi-domain regulatory protein [Frankiales bacterium]
MLIALLGPLELVVDDHVVAIPGAGERALLTLLALEPGRTISADRLIDALWGEDLPANPGNALQTRVSKLRKLVGAAVTTTPNGYALAVDDDAVDVTRFRRLVAAGRLADALALWRGAALGEFGDESWAAPVATRLDEERLAAWEARIDADLASGRQAAVLPELEQLVVDHPLRERFRAQLMLALYRSGRQADALTAYQSAADVLADELGLDPSPELRELQSAILRQDAALAAPQDQLVRRLPAPTSALIGRADELAGAAELLLEHRLVTLTGPGGTGKTTIAAELARRFEDAYPGGVWFVPLADLSEPQRLADVVLAEVGVISPDAPSARDLLAAYLGQRRALLVLDNCEHLVDAAAALVHQLLRQTSDLRILATSRAALGVSGEVQLTIPPLPADDAVALFAARAQAVAPSFRLDAATTPVVHALCERLDRMPLAIELAAVRVRSLPIDVIARRLDDRFSLLASGPRTADARHRTLQATVDWSHELLAAPERVLFRRLAVFAGSWSLEDAEAVCGDDTVPSYDVLDLLDRLVDQSLVVATAGRFRMLETIRVYAVERLHESPDAGPTEQRHAHHFTALVERAEEGLRGPEQVDWLTLLRADDANLRAALAWARRRGADDPDALLRLASSLAWFWYVGRQREGREELTAAIASAQGASPAVLGRALQALSIVERPGGCIVHPSARADGPARRSLPLFDSVGDEHRALISRVLTSVEAVGGVDVDATLDWLAHATVELEKLGDEWTAALALFVTMEIHAHQRSIEVALPLAEEGVERFRRIGDRWGMSAVSLHLGAALRASGRYAEAQPVLERALADARHAGMQNTVAGTLLEMAVLALATGDVSALERYVDEALPMSDELGNRMFHGYGQLTRAFAAYLGDDLGLAARLAQQGRDELTQEGVLVGAARADGLLAMCAVRQGQVPAARTHVDAALTAARGMSNAAVEARTLEVLAAVTAAEGDMPRAAELLSSAARIRAERERPADMVETADVERTRHAIA